MAQKQQELVNIGGGKFLPPAAAAMIKAANADMIKALGHGAIINSAYRSPEEQAVLYKKYHGKQAVALPGKSGHQWRGDVDIQNWQEARPYLEKHGFKWANYKNDPVHFNFIGGGAGMAPQMPSVIGINPKDYQQPAVPNIPPMYGSVDEMADRLNAGLPMENPEYTKGMDIAAKRQYKTSAPEIKPVKIDYKPVSSGFDANAFLNQIKETYPDAPASQPIPRNPIEQFGEGIKAPFTGYSPDTDITAQQEGGSLPYQAGNFLGQVGINVGGAGIGLLGGPIGSAVGGFAAGGALGARQEAQRQRLAGEQEDLGKQFGSGALQGGLNLIPAVGTGLKLLPRTVINAGLQGAGGVLGYGAQEAISQGTITPQLNAGAAGAALGLGAAGGAAGGLMSRGKPRPIDVGGQRRPVQVGGQMVGTDGNAARQRVVFGGMDVMPAPEPIRSTLDPTNPASYGLPETPKVNPVKYSAPVAVDTSYRLEHRAPTRETFEGNGRLDDLSTIYPEDLYSKDGITYYGDGNPVFDKESYRAIRAAHKNPDADVIIYRGVPDDVDSINSGDWITLSKSYAEDHIARVGGGKVLSKKVKVKELFSSGDSINEFGYDPIIPDVNEAVNLKPKSLKGTDAALYDVANSTPETNPAAWAAAREGLQEYGDLNIQDVGKKVGEVVDALPPGEVIPENITERLVAPKSKDPIANASPRPQMPAEIVATSRKLAGTVDEMIAQGTDASPIKTREQYNNLTKAYKELYGGIGRYNKDVKNGLIDLSDLTPDVMAQRGGMLNDMINTGAIIPQARVISPRVLRDFQVKYQQMLDGTMSEGQLAKMQATIADMEYRAQLQSLDDQMQTVHPEVRKAWEFDYDPQTKLAMQKEGADAETASRKKLQRFEDVSDGLPENLYNRGKMIEDAAKRGASLRIDADTEITGATSRVSQREVTPIGFYRTKDGHVGFTAYNDDGHLANYYITPKASLETGMISQVKSVEILGSEKFRGEYANVYLGPREFRIDDILKRPPRMEGITTSQARQTLRKAAGVFNNPELQALNPRVKELMDQISKNPDRMTIEDVKNIEDLLTADKKVLKAACEILGRM